MNCELAHEHIVAAAYGELPDDQVHQLERHVIACPECQKEREQILALKVLADAHPVIEPDPNLVARAHLRLDEALDMLPPRRWYEAARPAHREQLRQPAGRARCRAASARRRRRRRDSRRLRIRSEPRSPRRNRGPDHSSPPRAQVPAGRAFRNWPMSPESPASSATPTARSSTSASTRSFRARSRVRSTTPASASCSCWPLKILPPRCPRRLRGPARRRVPRGPQLPALRHSRRAHVCPALRSQPQGSPEGPSRAWSRT